jgi:hypothetical protein
MSYDNIAALMNDPEFYARINACTTEQSMVYKDDARPEFVRLAESVLLGGSGVFVPFICVAPGFGDVTDQTTITDPQILAAVQAVWPTVAQMTYPVLP